ncbi:hypothetical protein [Streptomyces sp. NPDC058240]|uniref:hypothetical protein n=1 Tax=Streptomyces sp. NPDC058240 TaxID=3346396 RepID=UPI0036EBB21E
MAAMTPTSGRRSCARWRRRSWTSCRTEPPLDLLDVLAEADEFSLLLAGRFDEGAEHGDDGGAEETGEALFAEPCDAGVE